MRKAAARLARVAIAASLLMPAGGLFAQISPEIHPAQKLRDASRVLVIAHRGCVGEAPEVSTASIHACVDSLPLPQRYAEYCKLLEAGASMLLRASPKTWWNS